MTEKNAYLAFSTFIPIGPARFKLLVKYYKSAGAAWEAPEDSLRKIGIGQRVLENFIKHRTKFDLGEYRRKLKSFGVSYVIETEKSYPRALLGLEGAPYLLYYAGDISILRRPAVAIVGSRKASSYGKEVATKFAGELGSFGVTIVSGLAKGIDTFSHKAALNVGGKTIAVIGSGLDRIYPSENLGLAREIVKKESLMISEYPLGYPAMPVNFAARNRIISGLSSAVIVIEGEQKSGTLLTASHAADQGRTVFAVPGQITSPLSAAPHFLLENGAKMATCVKDVLEELDMNFKVDKEKVEKLVPVTPDEEKILDLLENEELHLDEVVRILGRSTGEVSARLSIMEMKGIVKNVGNGMYKKN